MQHLPHLHLTNESRFPGAIWPQQEKLKENIWPSLLLLPSRLRSGPFFRVPPLKRLYFICFLSCLFFVFSKQTLLLMLINKQLSCQPLSLSSSIDLHYCYTCYTTVLLFYEFFVSRYIWENIKLKSLSIPKFIFWASCNRLKLDIKDRLHKLPWRPEKKFPVSTLITP